MKIILCIKEIRKEKKMSLKRLSEKSGVSRTHINDLENNLKEPSLEITIKLAKAFNKEITDLYYVKW